MHNKGPKVRSFKSIIMIFLFVLLACHSVTTNLRAKPTLFDTLYYLKRIIFQSAASITTDGGFIDTHVISDVQLSDCTIKLKDSRDRPTEYVINLKYLTDVSKDYVHENGNVIDIKGRISVNGYTEQNAAGLRLDSSSTATRFVKSFNHAMSLCKGPKKDQF